MIRPRGLALLAALLFAACGRPAPAPAPAAPTASTPELRSDALVRLLRGAEIQAETDAQRAELRRALQDLRDRPPAELAALRYAGADGTPGQRSLAEVLRAHLVPAQPMAVEIDALVAGRAGADGRAALDETIARIGAPAK